MSLETALESKLQIFFDKLDARLASVEKKIDTRLCDVEEKCKNLEITTKHHSNVQHKIKSDVTDLKTKVNVLEQRSLERNLIVRGIPESENENTSDLVDILFNYLDPNFESQTVVKAIRIGKKRENSNRVILAELVHFDRKKPLIKGIKSKIVSCSAFKYADGTPWGSSNDKIFVSDHLTPYMAEIFRRARQLKKNGIIDHAWTKYGLVHVKKDENSRAFVIKSLEQLTSFENKLDLVSECEDTDVETSSRTSKDSKRLRSPGKNTNRREPSKRLKQQQQQQQK